MSIRRTSATLLGLGAFGLAAITATAAIAATATAQPMRDDVPAPGESWQRNDPATDPAVESLIAELGISTDQAIVQMENQVAAGAAEKELPEDLRAVYGGRRIDHRDGGQVTIAVSDESKVDALRTHFAEFGLGEIGIVESNASLDELRDQAGSMQVRLIEAAPVEQRNLTVDLTTLGRLTVHYEEGKLNAVEDAILDEAQGSLQLFDVVAVDEIRRPGPNDACDRTDNIECDPPFRGSIRFHRSGTTGTSICTAGFNARSKTDLKGYVLTAGHCDEDSADRITLFADNSVHVIGAFHNSMNNTQSDTGIIRVNNESGWDFGWPYITVNDQNGGHTANDLYSISHVHDPGFQDRVCLTGGNFPATSCGDVWSTSSPGSGTADLFIAAGICAMGGDSGGPYFSYGVAYGIHITSDPGANCNEVVWAEHVIEAADRMGVRVMEW